MAITKPVWRPEPEFVSVSVDKSNVKHSPLQNEVVIYRDVNGERKSAIVPSQAFDEKSSTVVAAIVGDVGDSVILSFPSSSSGTNSWIVSKDAVQRLSQVNKQ